ncbi:hypothetical protein [Companilactobacillus metriopterae]|uniref:hypothetical protein n=1 Tax=Companilactobacillus metriopterae TaxID=1909267 RepID=UPI00100B5C2E|nr:hypothetical protein [Companilactobacillus metriopterae]
MKFQDLQKLQIIDYCLRIFDESSENKISYKIVTSVEGKLVTASFIKYENFAVYINSIDEMLNIYAKNFANNIEDEQNIFKQSRNIFFDQLGTNGFNDTVIPTNLLDHPDILISKLDTISETVLKNSSSFEEYPVAPFDIDSLDNSFHLDSINLNEIERLPFISLRKVSNN